MQSHDEVRKQVSQRYAELVEAAGTKRDEGLAASIGYPSEALKEVPEQAVASSFGCGNPVGFAEMGLGEVVVDLGSGAGMDLVLAAQKVGPTGRVIGVDMTEAMLERARANVAGLPQVELRRGIIEQLPVESGSVDWVISNCVINLSPEKGRVFAEIARVLKPGGRMRVSDIMAQGLPDWVRRSEAFYSSCVGGALSEQEYLEGLRAAGLEQAEVHERMVYDASQLLAFAEADPVLSKAAGGCGCSAGWSLVTPEVARALEGKIWSARVHAQKPVRAG